MEKLLRIKMRSQEIIWQIQLRWLKMWQPKFKIGKYVVRVRQSSATMCRVTLGKDYKTVLTELLEEYANGEDIDCGINNLFAAYGESADYNYLAGMFEVAVFDVISDYINATSGDYPVAENYRESIERMNK